MSREDNIRQLITYHTRRLQKLSEQHASFGLNTPPEILIEIEDIRSEIDRLQVEIDNGDGDTANEELLSYPSAIVEARFPAPSPYPVQLYSAIDEDQKARDYALQELAKGAEGYQASLNADVSGGHEGGNPYRGLLDYDVQHVGIFHGRGRATERLMYHMKRHFLTVLHADSGAGKSSLLQAGIIPRIIHAEDFPIYIRMTSQDPTLMLKRVLLPTVDQIPSLLQTTLGGFLWQVRRSINLSHDVKIYMIFDQFEEVFTQVDGAIRDRFVGELAGCLNDRRLNVFCVLALRKEYLSDLTTFSALGNPLTNAYRLEFLSREETHDVITLPAIQGGIPFTPELTHRLLDDLAQTEFYPPHLQQICHTLFEQARLRHESTISFDLYRAQGEAGGILRNYLGNVLARLSPPDQALSRRLLEFLSDSRHQRVVRTVADLNAELIHNRTSDDNDQVDALAASLNRVLEGLVQGHLLRQVQHHKLEQTELAYQLVHDHLVEKVNLDPEVRARKAVKEMLSQEVSDYQVHETLLSQNKLEFIEIRLEPTELHADDKELILHSAFNLDYNLQAWWQECSSEVRRTVLIRCFDSRRPQTRQRAAILAAEDNDRKLAPVLAELMQRDIETAVRQYAGLSLAQIDNDRFIDQIGEMYGASQTYPKQAMEIMAFVQDERPELLNLARLPGSSRFTTWGMRWLRINQNWARVGYTALYAAVGGAIAAMVGGFIGSWGASNQMNLISYSFFVGAIVGGSIGFGYGISLVIDRHWSLFRYAITSAFSGSLILYLFTIFGDYAEPDLRYFGWGLGLATGALGGFFVGLVTRGTELRIKDRRRRQVVRVPLCLLIAAVGGLLLVWADYKDIFPTEPDRPSYGYILTLFLIPGIVVLGLGHWNKS